MALDKPQLIQMLRTMILIREFDELAIQLRVAGKIYGAVHPYVGQEAVAVGVCSTLTARDRVTSTHRGHGHCIAKGADIRRMMAELFGRVDGYCKGKGGSMHIADFAVGMLGANGIVGGGLPIACGAALAAQLEGKGDVAVCFFGDGAAAEGEFHEALNIASLWKLPIVFVCENNQYAANNAVGRPASAARTSPRTPAPTTCPASPSTATTCWRCTRTTGEAVARARRGEGPSLRRVQDLSLALPRHARRRCPRRRGRPTRSRRGRPATRSRASSSDVLGQGVLSAAEIAAHARAGARSISTTRWPSPRPARFPIPRTCSSTCSPSKATRSQACARSRFQKALDEAVAEEMRRDPRVITLATDFTGRSRQGVRPGARALHADLRVGAHRHGPRGGGLRLPPHRELADGDVLVRGDGSDRQPGEQDPLHVRRAGRLPGDLPLLDGRRHRPRRPALAEPVLDVDASRRAEDHPARRRRPTPRAC